MGGLGAIVQRPHRQRGLADHQRVGLAQCFGEVGAAQDEQVTVFLDRPHEDVVSFQRRARLQLGCQPFALFGGDATSAAIGDQPLFVNGAEVAPRRQVVGLQVEADAQGREDATPHVVHERIVAEEGQMRRAAAGGDARRDGLAEPTAAFGGQAIQVRGVGGFQFRGAARFGGQSAETVHDKEHDLALARMCQPAHQVKVCHSVLLLLRQSRQHDDQVLLARGSKLQAKGIGRYPSLSPC